MAHFDYSILATNVQLDCVLCNAGFGINWIYFVIISLPNGAKANVANLKCCLAKGIPIIVMPSNIPKTICVKQIQIPPNNIQITFIKVDKHPDDLSLTRVSFPNGHKANPANFRVWSPNGMPMIVIISKILDTKYSKATINPPKINHIIFPKNLMLSYYSCC